MDRSFAPGVYPRCPPMIPAVDQYLWTRKSSVLSMPCEAQLEYLGGGNLKILSPFPADNSGRIPFTLPLERWPSRRFPVGPLVRKSYW